MKISYVTNVEALRANRELANTTSQLGDSFRILSSGKAAISAAAASIAAALKSDTQVAAVATRNTSDGISTTGVAIDGLGQIITILRRMLEIAQQSSNGAITNKQRSALSYEFNLLGDEADRTAIATTFNNNALLSNSAEIYVQVGLRGTALTNTILIPKTLGTLESVGLRSGANLLTVSVIANSEASSQAASRNALDPIEAAIETLTQRQSVLAATENRLHSAVNYISVARENFAAAEAKITDANIAEEVSKAARLQILQQTQAAVAAQANQNPQRVLELLRPPAGFA